MTTYTIGDTTIVTSPLITTHPGDNDAGARQRERITVSNILAHMGLPTQVMHHPDGSPYLDGYQGHISITHSQEIAAVAINPCIRVGIDTETWRPQLLRVVHKFLSPVEQAVYNTPTLLLRAWCMKEAAYKAAGIRGLYLVEGIILPDNPDYNEITIVPTNLKLKVYTIEATDTTATILCIPIGKS